MSWLREGLHTALLLAICAMQLFQIAWIASPTARDASPTVSCPACQPCADTCPAAAAAAATEGTRGEPPPTDALEAGAAEGAVPPHPSLQSFLRLQADPGLTAAEPSLLQEFEAAPWLLPPRVAGLPYAGVHGLDALLQLRGQAVRRHPKTVVLLPFSLRFADMLQNAVYSMVKFGRVRSYVVLAASPADLAACAAMNLPCADAAHLLPEPLDHGPDAGGFGTHDYLSIVWMKPAATLHALRRGFAVIVADADTAYANKPLVESFLALLESSAADAAFQAEGPLNTGVYAVLPTPGGVAMARKWAAAAPEGLAQRRDDNLLLSALNGDAYRLCFSAPQCRKARQTTTVDAGGEAVALLRIFNPAHYAYNPDYYAFSDLAAVPRVDPCEWTALFIHVVSLFNHDKREGLRRAGWWYLDSDASQPCPPAPGAASGVPACRPRQWRLPDTEARLYSCGAQLSPLGLVHPGIPQA